MKLEVSLPNTKISETFLKFAEPLLDNAAGIPPTSEQAEEVLKVAFTVWNAVVVDAMHGNTRFVADIRERVAHEPEIAALMERMIVRKQTLFGHDLRMIGNYKLVEKDGEWRLRAEARAGVAE